MKNIITAIIFFFSLTNITATVGGPQELTAIGYSDEEVFFVREYFDESARGAELWIYSISSGSITTDNSWSNADTYKETEAIIKEMRSKYSINKMKKAFDEYTYDVGNINITPLEAIEKFDPYNDQHYEIAPYTLEYNGHSITVEVCYSGEPKIHHHFTINDNHFAIVRYTGLCYETGYHKDTLFAFTDEFFVDTLAIAVPLDSNATMKTDSSAVEKGESEAEKTVWKRGEPNYLFIILPVVLIAVVFIVLKWKRKED